MNIPFNIKFTENHLDIYLEKYFSETLVQNNKNICFDLSITEWISTEEICFLFSWIRKLVLLEKKVKVILPFQYDVRLSDKITLEVLQLINESSYLDNLKRIDRRKRLNLFLMGVWRMLDRIGLSDLDFLNIIDGYNKKIEIVRDSNFSHQVIPFTVLDSSLKKERKIYVDTEFKDVLLGKRTRNNGDKDKFSNEIFKLNDSIIELLSNNNCFSPFESKIISHIITKELFINSLEHSSEEECYLAISLNNKWGTTKGDNFINHFMTEKDLDTLDFFKNKTSILYKQNNVLKSKEKFILEKEILNRETNLIHYNEDFIDFSYVQFTFMDFGVGIYNTLKDSFENYKINKQDNESLFHYTDIHSQILEYAFKMESSRNPYERDIEYSELIPRGLYFLIDMVRRFKGLLVARSGSGKVIYDFSDKIFLEISNNKPQLSLHRIYEVKEAIRNRTKEPAFFYGTMITIILPERGIENLKLTPVRVDNKDLNTYVYNYDSNEHFPREKFEPKQYVYISMVFIYHEAINVLSTKDLHNKNKINSFIFKKIDQKLDEIQKISSVLFIDFEFLFERSNYLKIISWLTNSPKVNEFSKVVILNLTKEESAVLELLKENHSFNDSFKDVEFLFKPIPCINATNPYNTSVTSSDIQWVGISDSKDEALLNNLLFGRKDSYPVSIFHNNWVTEGHIFSKFEGNTYSIFPDINLLIKEFRRAKIQYLTDWIANYEIKDGEKPKLNHKQHLFLTSRGSYQKKYISLYETLHNKYVARLYAKMLLDKFIERSIDDKTNLSELRFDKIIVVTVSSQLIGLAIRDLISNNEHYNYLSFYSKTGKKTTPKLIRLASYFSFNTEKPFEDIKLNDKVIIVNDVISTGSLIERLITGIKEKGAEVKSIMTIVDNRFTSSKIDAKTEYESLRFKDDIEDVIISLCSSINDERLKIEKYKYKPAGDFTIKRINPILNTVVELSYSHSEKNRVLFEDLQDFVSQEFSKEEVYRVGHYVQNLTHNGYYTDMHFLFEEENGEDVLLTMKKQIENKIQCLNLTRNESNKVFINNALSNINKINNVPYETTEKIRDIERKIEEVREFVELFSDNSYSKIEDYSPDFIFHPVFSGIEEVSEKTFHKVFGTDVDNIVGLQRYDTSVGWRFPFPAKRFNKITKGKHILIIDSGSLTGDSLIQLVDSISFLEVGRIDFLSIIGRIGDFQREFYSRLKSIKVKSLSNSPDEKRNIDSTVSLNLLFGINIHIPPYGSRTSCPFCNEIDILNEYKTKLNGKLPSAFNYIQRRLLNEINLIERREDIKPLHHFPTIKENGKCDLQSIFIMRDRIGKVASYRFYDEYFLYFDDLADSVGNDYFNNTYLKELEHILICVLHEPSLVNILRDLLVTNYEIVFNILKEIISQKSHFIHDLYYNWSKYSILKLYHYFMGDMIYEKSVIESICEFSRNDRESQDYLSFILIEPFLKVNSKGIRNKSLCIVSYISSNFDNGNGTLPFYFDDNIRRLFKDLLLTFEPVETEDVNQAFYNLKLFFDVVNNQHTKLFRANISLLNTIIKNENIDELPEIKHLAKTITKIIRECIYNNLKTIKHSELSILNDWPLHNPFIGKAPSLLTSIEDLEYKHEALLNIKQNDDKELIKQTIIEFQKELVDKIQTNYLLRDTNFYSYCIKYIVDLKSCINKALSDDDLKHYMSERSNFIIDEFPFENILVQGHSDYFYFAFQEIFVNAAKRKENDNSRITFSKQDFTKTDEVEIIITQHSSYLNNPQEKFGGLSKIVSPVFRAFCGEENVKYIKHIPNKYIIQIRFNTKNLKILKDE